MSLRFLLARAARVNCCLVQSNFLTRPRVNSWHTNGFVHRSNQRMAQWRPCLLIGKRDAAWLGLVPKQISTGDRIILGKISGDRPAEVLALKYIKLLTRELFHPSLKILTATEDSRIDPPQRHLIVSGEYDDTKAIGRIVMSNAQEAFAMTAALFGLSFAGIFLFWFAEKFRPARGPTIRR